MFAMKQYCIRFQVKKIEFANRVKGETKANTDLHDGGIILTDTTSTSDPL